MILKHDMMWERTKDVVPTERRKQTALDGKGSWQLRKWTRSPPCSRGSPSWGTTVCTLYAEGRARARGATP